MTLRRFHFILIALIAGVSLLSMSLPRRSIHAQAVPLPLEPDTTVLQSRDAVQLLTNGGFEIDADGDKIPDQWKEKNTHLPKKDKLKCNKNGKTFAYSGSCAFMVRGNPDGSKGKLKQTLTDTSAIVDGSRLTLSAYVDIPMGRPRATIGVTKIKLSSDEKITLRLEIPPFGVSGYTLLTDSIPVSIPNGVTVEKAVVYFGYYSGLIDESNAKYFVDEASLSVTPEDTLTSHLTADDGAVDDYFGGSVSMSGDGNTILVGAHSDDVGTNEDQGSAYIFMRGSEGGWIQQKLTGSDGTSYDYFGTSVSLSADGSTALVGSDIGVYNKSDTLGSMYVFVRNGDTWAEQQKLTAADGTELDYFGTSVSLSADGNTALIGANGDWSGDQQGSVYVFVRTGGTWTQQQKLTPNDTEKITNFGNSVSLSADGNTALIGSDADNGTTPATGAAYVFVRTGMVWTQQQKLSGDDSEQGFFGRAVSLSADGSTALIGALAEDLNTNSEQGAAYVFVRTGDSWTRQAKLLAHDGGGFDEFGGSVSVSADGNRVLVGTSKTIGGNAFQGAAYVFVREGDLWQEQQRLTASDGAAGDYFASDVSLSADGDTALIGVPYDAIGLNTGQGSAWVFELD